MRSRLEMSIGCGLLGLALVVCACGTEETGQAADSPVQPPPEAAERARAAADALTGDLMAALVRELNDGGPPRAVRVCSEIAQEKVALHSVEGLQVRRVSLKWRNPADEPDALEREILQELGSKHLEGARPDEVIRIVEENGARKLRYFRPIVVSQVCLPCHGDRDAMDPEVRSLVGRIYPDDKAVGYGTGDFRGAVSVTVDL